jgi:hypothetical protein
MFTNSPFARNAEWYASYFQKLFDGIPSGVRCSETKAKGVVGLAVLRPFPQFGSGNWTRLYFWFIRYPG